MTASAKEVIARALLDGSRNTTAAERGMPIDQRLATAILAALDAAGYVVVPREPTLPMQNAGWRVIDDQGFATEDTEVAPIYRAMIAAQETG